MSRHGDFKTMVSPSVQDRIEVDLLYSKALDPKPRPPFLSPWQPPLAYFVLVYVLCCALLITHPMG
jgi:hypothetical protein